MDRNLKRKRSKPSADERKQRRQLEHEEIQTLKAKIEEVSPDDLNTFDDFPISQKTKDGLSENNYTVPTEIQKTTVLDAIKGLDILGAAKTGSGKTLAFLIPVLERLFQEKWTSFDGLGALVITPTRELGMQIYQTLVKVGKHHDFSAGLIIGGKDVAFERSRLGAINIVIATPGRLLQHMDQNPNFECTRLQILVLDEADRCLDMGFEREMNAIIQNLPTDRQTLLFSATQTKKVKDLARLSLTDPKYISVHAHEKYKTPAGLVQSLTFCEQHDKMTVLWSFIRTHPKQKIIIFFATCNQVRFVYDMMCRLRPYNALFALHGKLKQEKRMFTFDSFCRKQHAVLFATDLASRGLDFPEVHWVVHADCPEDVDAYIHRSGRTARYYKGGESLLLLNESERPFVKLLEYNRIPIEEIKVNASQLVSPQGKMEAFLAKDPELKELAQKAFVAYAKSVYLMNNKEVFDIKKIDCNKFARSLGLVTTPRIRFIDRMEKSKQSKPNVKQVREAPEYNFHQDCGSDDDILTMKRKDHDLDNSDIPEVEPVPEKKKKPLTKAQLAKRIIKKNIKPGKKIQFDEDGEPILDRTRHKISDVGKKYEESDDENGINIDKVLEVIRAEDVSDKRVFGRKLKARRKAEKEREKEMKKAQKAFEVEKGEESDSGSEPDLSWLPDPDKVYSKSKKREIANSSEDEDDEDEDDDDDEEEDDDDEDDEDEDESSDEEMDTTDLKEKQELAMRLISKP